MTSRGSQKAMRSSSRIRRSRASSIFSSARWRAFVSASMRCAKSHCTRASTSGERRSCDLETPPPLYPAVSQAIGTGTPCATSCANISRDGLLRGFDGMIGDDFGFRTRGVRLLTVMKLFRAGGVARLSLALAILADSSTATPRSRGTEDAARPGTMMNPIDAGRSRRPKNSASQWERSRPHWGRC